MQLETGGRQATVWSALRAGQTLAGRYRIVRELGRGGMGAVFEAEHIELGRRFAIKTLLPHQLEEAGGLRRFQREAMICAALESKHIVAVVDWLVTEQGTPAIVMEHVAGESLRALLEREQTLPLRRAVQLLVQVCRGLGAAHAAGIIHRDLKPSNLLIQREHDGHEHCVVLDFGVAKTDENWEKSLESATTRTGALVGTLSYMSPEQIRGEKDLDVRSDIYALGAIFYECLSGARPFVAATPHALIYRILHEQPPSLLELRPNLPAKAWHTVQRALARDPAQRFQSVEELAAALNLLVDAPIGDDAGEATQREQGAVHDPLFRHPLLRAASVVLLAVVLLLVFTWKRAPVPIAAPAATEVTVRAAPSSALPPIVAPAVSAPQPTPSALASASASSAPRLATRPSANSARASAHVATMPQTIPDSTAYEGDRFDMRNPYQSDTTRSKLR